MRRGTPWGKVFLAEDMVLPVVEKEQGGSVAGLEGAEG